MSWVIREGEWDTTVRWVGQVLGVMETNSVEYIEKMYRVNASCLAGIKNAEEGMEEMVAGGTCAMCERHEVYRCHRSYWKSWYDCERMDIRSRSAILMDFEQGRSGCLC